MKVVIDTNVLVAALSQKSQYHWLIRQILEEKFDVHITDEIVWEYEEVLIQKYSYTVANNFIAALKELPNVYFTHIYFRWKLLPDADDNKFADCAIAANANYLVTHDRHFNILKRTAFPKINIVKLEELKEILF